VTVLPGNVGLMKLTVPPEEAHPTEADAAEKFAKVDLTPLRENFAS
jgi:hypothetical protein